MNIQSRMKKGKHKTRNWKKMVTIAATFALTVGIVSIPVQAIVKSVVKERMESIPVEKVRDINDMVQGQAALADGFSREYSDEEKGRKQELWQAYKDGKFPENVIEQVENEEAVTEEMLCYIRSTGVFNLPDREMTDEEILEIIDFQHKMSYAVTQSTVSQDARAEYQAEEARLEKIVQDVGGISGEDAIEIARKQLASDLGEKAEKLELMTDNSGSGVTLVDISGEIESKAGVAYDVGFGDPNGHTFTYGYIIDVVDGNILSTWK